MRLVSARFSSSCVSPSVRAPKKECRRNRSWGVIRPSCHAAQRSSPPQNRVSHNLCEVIHTGSAPRGVILMTAFRQPDADRSIAMATSQRRLSAILHADVTGFVRMMEGDEDLTVRHLKSAQTEVWRPAIEVAGGALVDNAGDSLLAEFDSALAAVAAAIDIQEHMAGFNAALDEERRLMLRIGVHLGEVIADEESGHIFGDGVNLAARIQGLAEPGGIAVSRAVRDVIEPQEAYALVDGGEHRAKNVSRRLHIYHVRVRDGAATR